jgi:hypothetical protein
MPHGGGPRSAAASASCTARPRAARSLAEPRHHLVLAQHPGRSVDNLDARRAVALALDRRAVARALGGGDLARPTCQLLPPGFAGFLPYCPFTASGTASGRPDLATARRLVERSGTRGAHVVVQSFDLLDRSVPEASASRSGCTPGWPTSRPRRPSSTSSRARPSAAALPSTSTPRSSATARPTGWSPRRSGPDHRSRPGAGAVVPRRAPGRRPGAAASGSQAPTSPSATELNPSRQ